MAFFLLFTQVLLLSSAVLSLASGSNQVKAARSGRRAAGVFMLMDGPNYTFDFTAATAACLSLNVTIATMTQMERAVQAGLETCKFGWIDGQISVVPRITADQKCGKGKTGVVTWRAKPSQKFGVFCFNASDTEETPKPSTPSPRTCSSSAPLLSTTPTSSHAATPAPSSPTEAPTEASTTSEPETAEPTQHTSLPSTTLLVRTAPPTGSSSTSLSLQPSSHLAATSPSPLTTSAPAVSAKPLLEAVPTALLVVGILFLILTAAGIMWYYKLSRRQQKQDMKTEVWNPDTELELHAEYEAAKEDDGDGTDRDDMLFVNPNTKPSSQ